ncbi:hypothetical protein KQX54_004904 [Cotesia glomerata]|uniref:Uncharacterized protein n=1 Tax=Cotesia glomerata TaxID=32391 RepID=A0AAV7J5H6_COTGL|nr:hypothetical protein KQX54_004904 [Cotesia glomerata]
MDTGNRLQQKRVNKNSAITKLALRKITIITKREISSNNDKVQREICDKFIYHVMASEIDENTVSQALGHILLNILDIYIVIRTRTRRRRTTTTTTAAAITDGIIPQSYRSSRRTRNISDVVVREALVSSPASESSPPTSTGISEIPSQNRRRSKSSRRSRSSRSMVAVTISDSVTIPTNPSMALNSTGVVTSSTTTGSTTTAAKPDQHIYNSTNYLSEQDDLEYSDSDSACGGTAVGLSKTLREPGTGSETKTHPTAGR